MKTLRFSRPKEAVYNETQYQIQVNGVQLASLKQGESAEVRVDVNQAEIQASTRFYGSRKAMVELGDEMEIQFSKTPGFLYRFHPLFELPLIAVCIWNIYYIDLPSIMNFFIGTGVLLMLLSIYRLVVKRNDWIRMSIQKKEQD